MPPRNPGHRGQPEITGDTAYADAGGDLASLIPDGFPTDAASLVAWTSIRRAALSAAMQQAADRDRRPVFETVRIPVAGIPTHFHSRDQAHQDDHFIRGLEELGPLAYSLMRGYSVVFDLQVRRLAHLENDYEDLVATVVGARAEGIENPEWLYREGTRLVFWDGLGLLLQVSEQLAVMVESIQQWRSAGGDLGGLILSAQPQPWRSFRSASFRSATWWRNQLGVRVSRAADARLSGDLRSQYRQLVREVDEQVRKEIELLPAVWTRDLHRIATRYKHSFPLMSGTHGVIWLGEDATTSERISQIARQGGLVIADTSSDGDVEQAAVAVTIGGVDLLFDAIRASVSLTARLVVSLLQRAEHPTRIIIPMNPLGPSGVSGEVLVQIVGALSGVKDAQDQLEYESRKTANRAAIESAARRLREAGRR